MSFYQSKVVVVTGASRGLGREFVKQLKEHGAVVYATCRRPSSDDEFELDVTKPETVVAFSQKLEKIDILVNNAGIATENHPTDPIVDSSLETLRHIFDVNVAGTISTTNALLELLRKGDDKIIANISSDLGSIERTMADKPGGNVAKGGVSSYRISKAALNMATRIYAAELPEFKVVSLAPGWVDTDLGARGGRSPPLQPPESISGMLDVVQNLQPEDSGKFFRYDNSPSPW